MKIKRTQPPKKKFVLRPRPTARRLGPYRAQSQLSDTRYPVVWYDLEVQGEIQTFDTQAEASLAAEMFQKATRKTRWRVVHVVEVLHE